MNRSELIHNLSNYAGVTQNQAALILDRLVYMIEYELKRNDVFRFHKVGTFNVKKRAARQGRNPATGEPIAIAARKVVTFTPSSDLKNAVN